jgi:hypothetical protein
MIPNSLATPFFYEPIAAFGAVAESAHSITAVVAISLASFPGGVLLPVLAAILVISAYKVWRHA